MHNLISGIKEAMPANGVVYGDARWRHTVWHRHKGQWIHMGQEDGTGFQQCPDAFTYARMFANTQDIFVLSTDTNDALTRLDDDDRTRTRL